MVIPAAGEKYSPQWFADHHPAPQGIQIYFSLYFVMTGMHALHMIIGVGIVQEQLKYMKNKPLGFDKESVVVLPMGDGMFEQYETIKNRLLARPEITDVTLSSRVPSGRLLGVPISGF